MSNVEEHTGSDDIAAALDQVVAEEAVQSNTMFQLAVMLARIAVEPGSEAYKDEASQTLLGLIRAKPKGNVVRLFGRGPTADGIASELRTTG